MHLLSITSQIHFESILMATKIVETICKQENKILCSGEYTYAT